MRTIFAAIALLALTAAQPAPRVPIEGYWKNPIGSAIIEIARCDDSLCGKVVWASARGQREASTSTSHVVGTIVLTGLRPARNRWTGTLFIPDDNVHVAARLQLLGDRQLKLTGCAVAGFFCRSQIWTRSDQPLPSSG
ncbi:MAG TPA: DUF2147 domain-containing protein [Sphingomicrobium sp.]|jgi:uncharacterized protein (DUF2147 family)|nr:DUF2147 domain-containing protein [Sphingomicrobium sp.]